MIKKAQKLLQMEAQILPCPEYRKMKEMRKTIALEEGDLIFDLIPTPTFLMKTDTRKTCKLTSQRPQGPNDDF